MPEVVMTASYSDKRPTIQFQLLDQSLAVHWKPLLYIWGYYNPVNSEGLGIVDVLSRTAIAAFVPEDALL